MVANFGLLKKLYYIFLVTGLLILGCTDRKEKFSYQNTPDSLSIYLKLANEDSVNLDNRLDYNKKAFAILLNQRNDSLNRINLFKVANRYFNLNNFQYYKNVSEIIVEKSIDVNDTISLAKSYTYLGDYYANTVKKDSAFLFYRKAEKLYKKLDDRVNLGITYIGMATVQSYESDFTGSELSAIKALNALRNTDESAKVYEAYNVLAVVSSELKDYDKALEYNEKALEVALKNNLTDFCQVSSSLNNIGYVYQNQNNDKLAIDKFKEALQDESLKIVRPQTYAILLDNLAYSKLKVKDFSELPDLFYQSLKIRDSLNITVGKIYSKIHLSEFYALVNDTLQAQELAKEALSISKQSKNFPAVLSSLKQLGVIELKNASNYSKEYIKINDSLQDSERKIKEKFARIEYETDEIILQKDKLAEQNRNMIFFFGLIIMIGILLFVIKNQRAKTKELILKQAQQKANEDIYNLMLYQQNKIEEGRANEKIRIAQELHDGILGRLFGARLNLDSLNKRQDAAAIDSRNTYLVELKNIEQDIREISHDLNREKSALNNNFISIINDLIEKQEALSDAKVSFLIDMEIEWEKVENNLKINLYRILQESLQNINKYAQAKNIKIEIKKSGTNLKLIVADDGIGFSVKKKSRGIGLQNMLSRAKACNGVLDVKSKLGKGTTIAITLPIETNTKTEFV